MDDQSRDYEAPVVKTDVPAIGITLQYPLDEGVGRGLVFQTFVASDCTTGDLNSALDKVRRAADRQRAIVSLPTLRGLLSDKEDALKAEIAKYYEAEVARDNLHNHRAHVLAASDRRNPKPSALDAAEDAKIQQLLQGGQSAILQLQKAIVIDKRKVADAEKLISDGE